MHHNFSGTEKTVQAGYIVSAGIAENMKPFADGEFVKKMLVDVAKVICPEKLSKFSNISLSRNTVARRVEDMSADIQQEHRVKFDTFQYFSIALDESTDMKDTAQLAIFVRGVSSNFDITEEFVQLVPLTGTTTGVDVFQATLQCLKEN